MSTKLNYKGIVESKPMTFPQLKLDHFTNTCTYLHTYCCAASMKMRPVVKLNYLVVSSDSPTLPCYYSKLWNF